MPVMSWQVREGARGMDGHTCVCTVKGHLELVLHVVHGRSDWRADARAQRGRTRLRRVAQVARAPAGCPHVRGEPSVHTALEAQTQLTGPRERCLGAAGAEAAAPYGPVLGGATTRSPESRRVPRCPPPVRCALLGASYGMLPAKTANSAARPLST